VWGLFPFHCWSVTSAQVNVINVSYVCSLGPEPGRTLLDHPFHCWRMFPYVTETSLSAQTGSYTGVTGMLAITRFTVGQELESRMSDTFSAGNLLFY